MGFGNRRLAAMRSTLETMDGEDAEPGLPLAHIEGNARAVLAAERTALNLMQRLSGIATRTAFSRC